MAGSHTAPAHAHFDGYVVSKFRAPANVLRSKRFVGRGAAGVKAKDCPRGQSFENAPCCRLGLPKKFRRKFFGKRRNRRKKQQTDRNLSVCAKCVVLKFRAPANVLRSKRFVGRGAAGVKAKGCPIGQPFDNAPCGDDVAQRRGFEPPYVFLRNTISSRARSTAPPSLHRLFIIHLYSNFVNLSGRCFIEKVVKTPIIMPAATLTAHTAGS